jgi:uncharacterized HAD superfamily protein
MKNWTWEIMARESGLLAGMLPPDTRGILGISRKGMMVATIVAERLHLPLGEAETFLRFGAWLGSGKRLPLFSANGPIVLVDDGCSQSARTLRGLLACLQKRFPSFGFRSAVLRIPEGPLPPVDYWVARYSSDEFQECEFLLTAACRRYAVDFDGVICHDPPQGETNDEAYWVNHFQTARPLYLPRLYPLGAIISARLEKYREASEQWLFRWGCRYQRLIFHPAETVESRGDAADIADWKADIYRDSPLSTFIESCPWQASQIAAKTGKRVFCPSSRELFVEAE